MDTLLGNGANGLANTVIKHWFAAMGLIGMLLFVTALVIDLPTDQTIVVCVGLIMFGYGFGQAECRTFREQVGHGFKITGPHWRLTVSGFLLFTIALGATIRLTAHLI